jgi:6-phosphogluconolactonase
MIIDPDKRHGGSKWLGLRLTVVGLFFCSFLSQAAVPQDSMFVYIGTYTGPKSQGIYVSRFDEATGRLSGPELAAESRNPSFLALHPSGQFLYAAGEVSEFNGKREGVLSAFTIDPNSGKLSLLNQQPSGGAGPCHAAVDNQGKWLLVANYDSGSIAALPIQPDGRLLQAAATIQHHGSSVNPQRQTGPHAHFISPEPGNRFALVCDLGLDKVLVYRMEPILGSNDFSSMAVVAGSGPRHLAFHPNGRVVFLINELTSTLTVCSYNAGRGELKPLQTLSTLPTDFKGENTCAEVQVHPSGKFVYGSNRGHDSIAVFVFDPRSARLGFVGCEPTQGKTPRHFALTPSGKWMVVENQGSDSVVVFAVDTTTGRLKPSGPSITVGQPVCAVFSRAK